jgi:hypothetical protein
LDWNDQDQVDSALDEATSTSLLAGRGQDPLADSRWSSHCRSTAGGSCEVANTWTATTAKLLHSDLATEEVQKMLPLSHGDLMSSRHTMVCSSLCAEAVSTNQADHHRGKQQQHTQVVSSHCWAPPAAEESEQLFKGRCSSATLAEESTGASSSIQQWDQGLPSQSYEAISVADISSTNQLMDAGKPQLCSHYVNFSDCLPPCGNVVIPQAACELHVPPAVGCLELCGDMFAAATALEGVLPAVLDGPGSSSSCDCCITGTVEAWGVQGGGCFGSLRDAIDGKGKGGLMLNDIPQLVRVKPSFCNQEVLL